MPVINLGCSDNQLFRAEKRVTCRIQRAAVRDARGAVLAEVWLPKPDRDGTGPAAPPGPEQGRVPWGAARGWGRRAREGSGRETEAEPR